MTVSSVEAERIAQDILSSNDEILSVAVIDKRGNILAGESTESFKERFELGNLESRYSGTLAIATLSIVNEVRAAFGEPKAIITVHKYCKLMLLPMLSYGTLIGLVLEHSSGLDEDKIANETERLVASILEIYT